ncbi:calpain 7 [Physocladia obscura]|uniref:Calpain 7 n=1 Tax=Physocladia obscura TaxID=109957 RepID=A0AAD5TCI3_9FUNG|nr:calpain 7 [Physocladia obscura]
MRATRADRKKRYPEAYLLYFSLCELLLDMAQNEKNESVRKAILEKAAEYVERTKIVRVMAYDSSSLTSSIIRDNKLDHINFLLERGLENDEMNNRKDAYNAYIKGCEIALDHIPEITNESTRVALSEKVSMILSRIEDLKPLLKDESEAKTPYPELSREELEILKQASVVNSKIFLPWMDNDVSECLWSINTDNPQNNHDTLFSDPDGLLPMSEEQISQFGSWKRVSEFMKAPRMVSVISSTAIVQDVVTDCSFVASLCVSAAYELKFQKQLITSCIYPQDSYGMPLFNPAGKYIVKLFFNGIYRKIVVDDYLPISNTGSLMCTYSNNENEIWPSIIEKAYMKLNGGYDFPGSNSGIDLYGKALITLATIDMDNEKATLIGLVPTHAYAGQFSHLDDKNWTPQLKAALNFDQLGAMQHDDGIFWIDFNSVMQYFESIHVNWNPALFRYQHVMHVSWPVEAGPAVDAYSLAHNPQYGLEIDLTDTYPTDSESTVWLLLSKHVTTKEENRDYITLHIYADTNCRRVYYPEMYKVIYVGVYVNNPHILASFKVDPSLLSIRNENGKLIKKLRYTAVVSQHEKSRTLTFSLRAYAKEKFKFGTIGREYPYERIVRKTMAQSSINMPVQTWTEPLKILEGIIDEGRFFIMAEIEDNDDSNLAALTIHIVDAYTEQIVLQTGQPRPKFTFIETSIKRATYRIVTFVVGVVQGGENIVRLTVRSENPFE